MRNLVSSGKASTMHGTQKKGASGFRSRRFDVAKVSQKSTTLIQG
jgi:hypothetical protein